MKKGYLAASAAFALVALYVIWQCSSFPAGRRGVPGPALYPTAVAVLMLLSSISLAITAIRLTPAENKPLNLLCDNTKRVYIAMVVVLAYVAAMYFIGFLTSSIVMLFGCISWFGKYKPHLCAVWSIAIAGVVYAAFRYLLMVPFRFGVLL